MHPDLTHWFESEIGKPFAFQKQTWQAYADGYSGLLHAPTGHGKSLAVYLGALSQMIEEKGADLTERQAKLLGCRIIWITPLRALASDTLKALRRPVEDLGLNFTVDARTGDTSSYRKAKLRETFPNCLVTTPESLSLLFTYPDTRQKLKNLKCIVFDEWDELTGNKRGVQAELCLTRIRTWRPNIQAWGVSATFGDLAGSALPLQGTEKFKTISADIKKNLRINTLIPKQIESFPWAGHLGTRLAPQVANLLEKSNSTLLFTNTRSQTEIWYQEMLKRLPEWQDRIAIHHGSLSRKVRTEVEDKLKDGELRCVVCTSSLDLGIDFSPVDQVIQIGSPKGISRLTQRAGRSGHSPGQVSKITCVPTNALELVEFAAVRDSWQGNHLEKRTPLKKPLDVLVQHLVTLIIGNPTTAAKLKKEILSSYTYHDLTDMEWQWAMDFIIHGGPLSAYPQFKKVIDENGTLSVQDKRIIQLHRMNIGTITSDSAILIKYANGHVLGTIEEAFISKLKPGKQFIFAGKRLELVRFYKLTATVRNAIQKVRGNVPTWNGGRMPLSSELATAVASKLRTPGVSEEMQAVAPILKIQSEWSSLPGTDQLLIEHTRTRDAEHLFFYPFAGRLVHEGLATLVAYRLSKEVSESIHVTQNDYGFSLSARAALNLDEVVFRQCFSVENLIPDLEACMNTAELARRQFREVARVAGLIVPQLPGRHRNNREVQVSAKLLYEVFQRYDKDNLLLKQASSEILTKQLEINRLTKTLDALQNKPFTLRETKRLTPMAFPLWADRLSAYLPAGDAVTRLEKMLAQLENATL